MSNIPQGCKAFNLQEALEGKTVITRGGRKVKIAGYNPDAGVGQYHQVIGWMDSKVIGFNESGSWNGTMSDNDLFMAPETKDVWVIVYEFEGTIMSHIAESENEAAQIHSNLGKGRPSFGIHKITITV